MSENENVEENNLPVATGEKRNEDLKVAWREVGDQFQQLGSKLADTIRRSWSSSSSTEKAESEETMSRLRDDLRAAADRVNEAIHQVGDETREERASTLKATRRASEQSLEEVRLLTASTLRKLNNQLDQLVSRLEKSEQDESTQEETEQK